MFGGGAPYGEGNVTLESKIARLLELVGITQPVRDLDLEGYPEYASWKAHGHRVGSPDSDIRAVFIKSGPRGIKSVQKMAKRCDLRGVIAFSTKKAGHGILLRPEEKK